VYFDVRGGKVTHNRPWSVMR